MVGRSLALEAQSNRDPDIAQNYIQQEDHYFRRYYELKEKTKISEKNISQEESLEKKLVSTVN